MGDNGLLCPKSTHSSPQRPNCPLSIFHFLETLMIKLQCTNGRRKAQRGQGTCPRPHTTETGLVLRLQRPPPPSQPRPPLYCSYPMSLSATRQTLTPFNPRDPDWTLQSCSWSRGTQEPKSQGAKTYYHLLYTRHVHATSFSQHGSRASSPMEMRTRGSGK